MTIPTLNRLRELKLGGMAHALQQQQEQPGPYAELSFTERLAMLVEQEHLLRISAIAIACFGIIRSLLFLTYSFTLTDRNPLFFSLIHPLIRSDGCCEPIDPVTHPLPLDFRSCCTIH